MFGDVRSIVRREIVPRGAYRTSPVFESKVHLAMRVQYCLALLAKYWLIFDNCEIFDVFKGSVNGTHGQDNPGLGEFVGRPVVPREPEAILELSLVEIHILIITYYFLIRPSP